MSPPRRAVNYSRLTALSGRRRSGTLAANPEGAALRLRDACLAALCAVAPVAAAQAQSVAGTLNAFGFFGTWAVQCGAPPAPGNVVETVTWTGHEPVEFSAAATAGAANRYRVISAQALN